METIHVVGFAGSLRSGSLNKALLRAAGEMMPEGMELETLDLAPLPFYNQELEALGLPEPVRYFRDRVAAADAVLISTPEYNYTTSSALKNALEWLSRPLPSMPANGKPAAVIGGGGLSGSARAQNHVRQMAVSVGLVMMGKPEVLVVNAWEKFDAQGNLVDETTRKFVREHLLAFREWILRVQV